MFEEEGSHYWILAILFVGALLIISALYITGILKLNAPPEPPKNVQISQVGNTLKITWTKSISTDVIGYNIYRSKQYSVIGDKINVDLINGSEYIDNSLIEDGTYFYLVKAVDSIQEDEYENQVSYYFDTAPPYGTTISINKGEKYTGSNKVKLYLSSLDSNKCRYKNEGGNWTDYLIYVLTKDWNIINEEGVQIVYYQCEDKNYNEGPIVSDSIILDKTSPNIEFIKEVSSLYSKEDEIIFEFEVKDNYPNNLSCYVYLNTTLLKNQTKIFLEEPIDFEIIINKQDIGNYTLTIECKDESNNKQTITKNIYIVDFGEYRSKNINISINKGDRETTNRDVILYLSSNTAELCRYKNEERSWSEWEKYKKEVSWTLSNDEGIKTVFVECLNKNNQTIGINWDDIEYKLASGGSPTPSCNKKPDNLNIKIEEGKCTNSLDLTLKLFAQCADECTYREVESGIWRGWEDYRTLKYFTLSARYGEGIKKIEYKCRNKFGESEIVSALVLFDTTPPMDCVDLSGKAQEDGKIRLSWISLENKNFVFNIYKQGLNGRIFNLVDSTEKNYWIDYDTYNEQEHRYYVVVEDCAGNEGLTQSNIISIIADSKKPEVDISHPYENEEFTNTRINLEFYLEDNISESLSCEYQAGSSRKSLGTLNTNTYLTKQISLSPNSNQYGEQKLTIYLYCKDEAGNEGYDYINIKYIKEIEVEEEDIGPGPLD